MDKRGYSKKRQKRNCLLCYLISRGLVVCCLSFISFNAPAQELYPNTEPASTMSKKLFGFRQINEVYKDVANRAKYYTGFRLMYGLTKNLTLMTMFGASNHHLKRMPANFTGYLTNHHTVQY